MCVCGAWSCSAACVHLRQLKACLIRERDVSCGLAGRERRQKQSANIAGARKQREGVKDPMGYGVLGCRAYFMSGCVCACMRVFVGFL